ncbi:MAG TPA: S1 RNA-binding domain-containing protein, partial [Gemmatimonadetes bacterium]|nr:S1 RNA-binding domain-containing protein [Gemmatimonadota bacterium]
VVTGSGLRGNRKTRGVGSGEYRLRRQPTLHLSRAEFETFSFAEVHALSDLRAGMVLPGIVTNVTAFGAFVDIGVHQDGLAHISELADRFVKDPNEVVRVRQQVEVRVLQVDSERKRIGLSMKKG